MYLFQFVTLLMATAQASVVDTYHQLPRFKQLTELETKVGKWALVSITQQNSDGDLISTPKMWTTYLRISPIKALREGPQSYSVAISTQLDNRLAIHRQQHFKEIQSIQNGSLYLNLNDTHSYQCRFGRGRETLICKVADYSYEEPSEVSNGYLESDVSYQEFRFVDEK